MALHIGTLVAVVAYFRHDLVVYARDGLRVVFKRREPLDAGRPPGLAAAAVVGAGRAVGGALRDTIDEQLGTIPLIAVSLIVFGLLLGWADQLPEAHPADRRACTARTP